MRTFCHTCPHPGPPPLGGGGGTVGSLQTSYGSPLPRPAGEG
ncbi:hypothetical protein [Azospirillum doebereinerae]